MGKGDQEALSNETILQKVHLEKKIVHRVSTTKEEMIVFIESVVIGIVRNANMSGKMNVKWERIVRSSTHQRRIDVPVQKEMVKDQNPNKEKVTVAILNIANRRPRDTSGKLLQFETSQNAHLKAEKP